MEKAVDFTRLEKNIIEVIQEEQIKLGYRSELIRLYYPIKVSVSALQFRRAVLIMCMNTRTEVSSFPVL